jgi:DNA-binding MarR family transcriptional regulator
VPAEGAAQADGGGSGAAIGEPDEVDRIVTAWRRERPDLNVGPLEVLSRVTRLARLLDRARAAAFDRHGLETWEFDVLSALRRAGAPYQLSAGQLVGATLVTSGTMTNRIDRLTARGLVRRQPDPADGRGVMVRLEPSGVTLADSALADLLEVERGLLSVLGPGEQDHLSRLLRDMLRNF